MSYAEKLRNENISRKKKMNSRERVLKAVNFEKPDRVPIDLGALRASGINAVVYDKLKKRMGIKSPYYQQTKEGKKSEGHDYRKAFQLVL